MDMNNTLFEYMISTPHPAVTDGETIGYSRKGQPIQAFRMGSGPLNISLIGGLHADEPVGPRFLRHFTTFLRMLPNNHMLLTKFTWWIIPHGNPDGELNNAIWTAKGNGFYQLSNYLLSAVREAPGDDMEFGFPIDQHDKHARPENKAIYRWWETAENPFQLHMSCHGMLFGEGPWFLIDPTWISRSKPIIETCTALTEELGYRLNDSNRKGEKGFMRITKGFSTRPDSKYMKEYFMGINEPEMASKFRPSSMEAIRSISGDTLTLVSETPLFLVPPTLDPNISQTSITQKWREQFDIWRRDGNPERIEKEAIMLGIKPMAVKDQMKIIFSFLFSGLSLIDKIEL